MCSSRIPAYFSCSSKLVHELAASSVSPMPLLYFAKGMSELPDIPAFGPPEIGALVAMIGKPSASLKSKELFRHFVLEAVMAHCNTEDVHIEELLRLFAVFPRGFFVFGSERAEKVGKWLLERFKVYAELKAGLRAYFESTGIAHFVLV